MTLVLAIASPETLWMVADRRLSYKTLRTRDDARKIMCLETTDGAALLGYAGLGATALGNEPSDWMASVHRGPKRSLEQSLNVLADAAQEQMPQHVKHLPPGAQSHSIVVPAYVNNEARMYTIELAVSRKDRSCRFRYTRPVIRNKDGHIVGPPRFGLSGTGGLFLSRNKDWVRPLLRLTKAHDHRAVSTRFVADRLASINHMAHINLTDKSVGPDCIVACKFRRDGVHGGGGGHWLYNGTTVQKSISPLPTVAGGIDVEALLAEVGPLMFKRLRTPNGDSKVSSQSFEEEMRTATARVPTSPDRKLR